MPDAPAQHTFVLTKAEYGATTERMATPEELLALQLLAEEEQAVMEALESASQRPEPKPKAAPEGSPAASTDRSVAQTAAPASDERDLLPLGVGEHVTEAAAPPEPAP